MSEESKEKHSDLEGMGDQPSCPSDVAVAETYLTTTNGHDVLDMHDLDPALNLKMHLINDVGHSLASKMSQADSGYRPLTKSDGHHTISNCFS